jgi:glyoxylase-like metal-dependent hydrolase (beta-lactamase superfamily II)
VLASGLSPKTPTSDGSGEVLPGVHLVELPLPFALGSINVYLVRLADGYLLIDCGMDTEACFQALARAVEAAGAEWRNISEILLTHVHPDHMGLAPRLLELTGARLSMHAHDAKYLRELTQTERYLAWAEGVMREAGVPGEIIAKIGVSSNEIHKHFHNLKPDRVLQGGERIAAGVGELEVLWTPGHSPGHVCLYGRERRVLFAGDQMLEQISPNIGWLPDRDPLGEFLDSLRELERLEIELILPSHGAPFSGHREWIRKTIAHHAERCARILGFLDGASQSAADVVNELWERKLTPFHYRFAVFEVLAHLEYLERQGKVARVSGDPIVRWRMT